MKRLVPCAAILAIVTLGGTPAHASNGLGGGHIRVFPIRDQSHGHGPGHGASNLIYHGGPVETSTRVYINFWGSQWSTTSYSQATSYIKGFFGSVGGGSWINTDTQYCQSSLISFTTCPSGSTFIGNPNNQLAGTMLDSTAVPSQPSQADIEAAAARLEGHFGYSSNATYLVFTPSGQSQSGFATSWCAYHGTASSAGGTIAFAYIPYQPDAGASCGANSVNGVYDGFSIVGGHEYEESQTDPMLNAWYDASGNEDADKCAWTGLADAPGTSYAVQTLWSNASSGCVLSYP